MKRVLIYIEQEYIQDGIDLLEVARQVYPDEKYLSYAITLKGDIHELKGLFTRVFHVTHDLIHPYHTAGIARIIETLHDEYHFDAILIPASFYGRLVAPHTAMLLDTGLVADVTEIAHTKEGLELIRPAYSGKMRAGIQIVGGGPVMMSIRPSVFSYTGSKMENTKVIEIEEVYFPFPFPSSFF